MRLYIDSNIFISLIREEVFVNRTLFSETLNFFEKVSKKRDTLIISTLTLFEIETKCYNTKKDLIENLATKKN